MLPRHAISDTDWDRLKHLLPGQPGQHGGVAKDNRLFIDAILYVARTEGGQLSGVRESGRGDADGQMTRPSQVLRLVSIRPRHSLSVEVFPIH
jgi:hypothetical protein